MPEITYDWVEGPFGTALLANGVCVGSVYPDSERSANWVTFNGISEIEDFGYLTRFQAAEDLLFDVKPMIERVIRMLEEMGVIYD